MKLTTLLLVVTMLQVSAGSYAQRITLNQKNVVLVKVFDQIRIQTGYDFIFNNSILKDAKKVTITVKNAELEEVLQQIFEDQPLKYEINDNKSVVVTKKNKSFVDKVIDYFSAIDVRGKVIDERGEPLQGATVKVKGSTLGTMTDKDGEFFLKGVSDDAVIVVAYLGYKPLERKAVANMGVIKLELSSADLQEVMVSTGFWTSSRQLSTSSTAKVSAQTIEKQPVLNPLAAMQGRMTGVNITQTTGIPGGDFKIEIRGRNSLRMDGNNPLYVVDGVPFSIDKVSTSLNTGGILGTGASPLNGINNADIESIEVLKDADATAIYGSRGANGVVLIRTKRGKAGKTNFNVDVYTGAARAPRVKMMGIQDYLAIRRQAFANDGIAPSADPNSDNYAPDLSIWDSQKETDWQEVLMGGTARTSSFQSSVSGGNENTQFLFSAGYRRETTIFPADFAFTKASGHLALNHRSADKKFILNVSLTGTADENNNTYIDLANTARRLAPNAPDLYNADGSLNWGRYELDPISRDSISTWTNPIAGLNRKYKGLSSTFVSNAIIGYEFLPGLLLKSSFGLTQLVSSETTKNPSTIYDPYTPQASSSRSTVSIGDGANISWNIEPQLSYERELGPGKISMLLGSSFQQQSLRRNADLYQDFPSNSLLDNVATAKDHFVYEFIRSQYRYAAVFGRLNYQLEEKYIVNLTGRRDGSSRFGPGNRFGNFGAVGLAWIFSKEDLVKRNLSFLSFGKIRGSYGTSGNDQIPNYQYLENYATVNTTNNQYDGVTGLAPSRLFNPVFGWELNKKLEVALELGFFNDRISLTTAWYRNRSSNQLIQYALPVTTGFSSILSNFPATIQNTGLEFELNTENISRSMFRWTTSFNLSVPNNQLIAFPNIEASTYANQYTVGKSIYLNKVYEYTGVDPQTGLYSFKDYNNDGIVKSPDDRKMDAFTGQYYFGGMGNTFSYKSWSLDLFLQYVNQRGYNYFYDAPVGGLYVNLPAFLLDLKTWEKPGDVADLQRLTINSSGLETNGLLTFRTSDGAISDASFVRLKNVSLTWQMPQDLLKGVTGRLYLQAQNLWVWSRYKWYDPETQLTGTGPLMALTAGVQLNF